MKRWGAVYFVALALCVAVLVWLHRRGEREGAETLMVYCAAGLKKPVEEAAQQFEAETGTRVELQFGGSGTLLSQVRVSGRGDLLLAADEGTMGEAQKAGVVREVTRLVVQTPVIAVAKGNPKAVHTIDDLLRGDVRVALANPEAASIGKIGRAALGEKWNALAAKAAVMKPTVTELATDLSLGAVDAAIIWDSLLPQFGGLEPVHVPELDARPEYAVAAVLTSSRRVEKAQGFVHFLAEPEKGGAIFRKRGFKPAPR